MLDVVIASHVSRGEQFTQAPIEVKGLFVEPASTTLSSQATGAAGASAFRARHTSGRVRIHDKVIDLAGAEEAVITENGALTSGQAMWCTLVAVQHKLSGGIGLAWVRGTAATYGSHVVKTQAEIVTALGQDDQVAMLAICGDIEFYRSADTTVVTSVSSKRRAAYVDESSKTGITETVAAATLEEEFGGFIDFPITLASAFALNAGDLYSVAPAPDLPFGGVIKRWEYIGAVSGAGAGADMTLKAQIDGVVVTGSDMQLLLAATAIAAGGARVAGGTITAANTFKPKASIGVEVDAKPTAFSGGSGIIRMHYNKLVPVRF